MVYLPSVARGRAAPWALALALVACGSPASNGGEAAAGGGGAGATAGEGGGGGTGEAGAGGAGGEGRPPWSWPCEAGGVQGHCMPVESCTGDLEPIPGACPGPAGFQCCVPKPPTCDPDARPLPNASLAEAPGKGGCPSGMTRVDDFCVDVYEASLVDGETGDSLCPYANPGDALTRAVSIDGAVPQAYIDQIQAGSACLAADKRLCTDDEWLRACQGPDGLTYPYGDTLALGTCNDHRDEHPVIEYYGTTDDWIWSALDNACIDQLPASLAPSGSFPACKTAEGAFDMVGNLHEWTADPAGTFRGGYYVDTAINGPGCLYRTTAHDVSHWDYSTGFRCCADP